MDPKVSPYSQFRLPMFDEQGRELASRSPWAFLDRCETPAERQAAIYRHQHKSRASHFADQDRAEAHADRARLWRESCQRVEEEAVTERRWALESGRVEGAIVAVVVTIAALSVWVLLGAV
jgi:hypothetical protein